MNEQTEAETSNVASRHGNISSQTVGDIREGGIFPVKGRDVCLAMRMRRMWHVT